MAEGIAAVAIVVFAARRLARRLGVTFAPTTPEAWWRCARCRSLNPIGRQACYRCREPWSPAAPEVPTAAHPETPQSFGNPKAFEDEEPHRQGPFAPGG